MKIVYRSRLGRTILAGVFLLCAVVAWATSAQAADIETDAFSISLLSKTLSTESVVTLQIERLKQSCHLVLTNAITIDNLSGRVDISLAFVPFDFAVPCITPEVETKIVGTLDREGSYQVSVFAEMADDSEVFAAENLLGSIPVTVEPASTLALPEVPQEGSIQSGVGVIRGWACDAKIVEVQIDEMPRLRLAYGSSRADTEHVCGDVNNGYGVVIAWGLFGEGTHRMKTFIDGRERSDVEFEVAGLNDPFFEGLSGSYQLEEFPAPGQSAVVRWSEAAQNFIIVEHKE